MIKAVIFDFDGTLANRQDYAAYEIRKFVRTHFNDVDESSIEFESIVQSILNWDGFGNTNKTVLGSLIKKKYKIDFDETTYSRWWLDNMLEYVSIFDDTIETLEYLKPKYKLAILSNGDTTAQRGKIRLSGLEPYMDFILATGEIGIHKPDTRPFLYVCEKLNIKPEEAVFVGDTFSTDIVGAYNAGLKPVWIWPDKNRISNFPVQRIYTISDLKNIL